MGLGYCSKFYKDPEQQGNNHKKGKDSSYKKGYKIFSDYLAHIKSHPQVEIVTAAQSALLYQDRASGKDFSREEIIHLASLTDSEISYQLMDDVALSPAEIFYLVISALAAYSESGDLPDSVPLQTPLGPVERARNTVEDMVIAPIDFLRACTVIRDFIHKAQRLPSTVYLGSHKISPADFLATACSALASIAESGDLPGSVELCRGSFALEKYVTGEGAWGWVIFPEGFDAPGLIELGKLQTWTLKPALFLL